MIGRLCLNRSVWIWRLLESVDRRLIDSLVGTHFDVPAQEIQEFDLSWQRAVVRDSRALKIRLGRQASRTPL